MDRRTNRSKDRRTGPNQYASSTSSKLGPYKIDSFISTSELLPVSYPYSVYRKDRTHDGGSVMLLIHKDISHLSIKDLENNSVC